VRCLFRSASAGVFLVVMFLPGSISLAAEPSPSGPEPSPAAEGLPSDGAATGASEAPTPDEPNAEKPYWRHNLFKRVFSDQKFLFTDWIGQEAHRPGVTMAFVGGIALAASSQASDWDNLDLELERHVFSSVDAEHSKVAIGFTELGNAGPAVLFLGASYLIGRFGGHENLSEATSLSAEALLDTGLWTTVIKRLTARTRPSAGGEGTFFEYQPQGGQSNASFPSGHASGAFALATVFSGIYGPEHRWVPWVTYGAAGMVGLSRIGLGRHFTSDVVIGSVIGNSFGRMVLARRDGAAARKIQPTFGPTFDPETGATGAQATLRW
jgi:membrane-associated phospholipid phosphatase